MATVKEHYDRVLSEVYSWMFGGFDSGIERNTGFFEKHKISPVRSGEAIDLGAGCGFQSIPLAKAGFSVIAVDIDGKLLNELKNNSGTLAVNIVQDDLITLCNQSGFEYAVNQAWQAWYASLPACLAVNDTIGILCPCHNIDSA